MRVISTSGSPKTMNRLPAPVFLSSSSPIERSGFICASQHGQLAVAFRFFGDVRVEGEAADDEHVEADALDGFLGGFLHLLRADGAVLRADGDGDAPGLGLRVGVRSPAAWSHWPGYGSSRSKTSRSLLTVFCTPALRRLSRIMCRTGGRIALALLLRSRPLLVGREYPMRREALDRERTAHTDALVVLVGLVVEQFGLGVTLDGRVDLLRVMPSLMSGLLAMDLSVTCGTRL